MQVKGGINVKAIVKVKARNVKCRDVQGVKGKDEKMR